GFSPSDDAGDPNLRTTEYFAVAAIERDACRARCNASQSLGPATSAGSPCWSVPLSLTTVSGRPRRAMMASSSRATRRPEIEVSTTSAKHSLVWSSTTVQARGDYLRERRRELVTGAQAKGATPRDAAIVADACVDAARRIMTELLALRTFSSASPGMTIEVIAPLFSVKPVTRTKAIIAGVIPSLPVTRS